uniref:C-type lectin domain-containing protein n=1 Tax=Strongyloides stercoralis TaxID=6248 RepID=A0AAF5DCQ5_STRER
MQKLAYFYFLALLAVPIICGSHETSASKSAEENKDTCTELVEEHGESGKPILIEALWNISLTLTGNDQVTFQEFITYLQDTYFDSGNYTSTEIVLECSFEIYQFLKKTNNYYSQFQYTVIGTWGTFYDLFQVGIYLSADKFGGCWSENSSGEYDLLISFETFQETLSQSDQSIFQTYITQLQTIISSTEELSIKYSQFYSLCLQITTQHSEWESSFYSTECGSMGSLYMLIQISSQYYRISLIPTLFTGTPQCPFIEGLESCLSNPSYTISCSDKAYLNITILSFQEIINDESLTYTEKIQYIIYKYEKFLITFDYLEDLFLSLEISSEFGTFQDFISIFTFGQTQDCWPEGFENITSSEITEKITEEVTSEQSTQEVTTEQSTVEVTTEEAADTTTYIPTTTTITIKPTTTPIKGNCATAPKQCLALSGNWSVIYTSSTKQWGSWTASQKTNWKNECTSFTNKYIKNQNMTPIQKIKNVVTSIKKYVQTFTYMKVKIFAIQIVQWGTIGQLCGCY